MACWPIGGAPSAGAEPALAAGGGRRGPANCRGSGHAARAGAAAVLPQLWRYAAAVPGVAGGPGGGRARAVGQLVRPAGRGPAVAVLSASDARPVAAFVLRPRPEAWLPRRC